MCIKKDVTLGDLCSIHTQFCWLSKEVIFHEEVSTDRKNICWDIMENFSNLVVSDDIGYKQSLMNSTWDVLFKFVNAYIRDDGNLPYRRGAVEIYERMKPIEDARTNKEEK